MKEIELNTKSTVSLEVTDDNTAVAAGSGSLRVLGTPFMIALMEKATCNAVQGFLDFGKPPSAQAFPFLMIRQVRLASL